MLDSRLSLFSGTSILGWMVQRLMHKSSWKFILIQSHFLATVNERSTKNTRNMLWWVQDFFMSYYLTRVLLADGGAAIIVYWRNPVFIFWFRHFAFESGGTKRKYLTQKFSFVFDISLTFWIMRTNYRFGMYSVVVLLYRKSCFFSGLMSTEFQHFHTKFFLLRRLQRWNFPHFECMLKSYDCSFFFYYLNVSITFWNSLILNFRPFWHVNFEDSGLRFWRKF